MAQALVIGVKNEQFIKTVLTTNEVESLVPWLKVSLRDVRTEWGAASVALADSIEALLIAFGEEVE